MFSSRKSIIPKEVILHLLEKWKEDTRSKNSNEGFLDDSKDDSMVQDKSFCDNNNVYHYDNETADKNKIRSL